MKSRRVQVTLTDAEFAAMTQLAELRGMSWSAVLAEPISRLLPHWKREIRELRKLRRRQAKAEQTMESLEADAEALRARLAWPDQ